MPGRTEGGISGGRRSRLEAAVPAAAAAGVLAFLVCEVYSLDVWWQVAIGRDILARLAIPRVDRYTVLGLGRPYHDSHWLFQVVAALADRVAGMAGVEALAVALWTVALVAVYRACRRRVAAAPAAALAWLAAMASVERFLPRPELVTYVGIAWTWLLLERRAWRSPTGLVALGALGAVWTNAHGLFVLGPFMALCYALDAWLPGGRVALRDRRGRLAALAVIAGGTLLSPHPLAGWRYAVLLATEAGGRGPAVFAGLGELSPVLGTAARSSPAFWFFAGLVALATAAAVALVRRREAWPRLAIAAALLAAALTGRRNVVLFALVAAPLVAEAAAALPSPGPALRRAGAAVAIAASLGWAWYPLSGGYYLHMEIPARFGLGATPSFFPHRLPAFLDRIGFRGNVLNSNTLGGFYLYWGYPGRLPLTDGRWEVYEPRALEEVLRDSRRPGAWRRVVARYGIRGLLLAHTSPEAAAIVPEVARDRRWRLVYLDTAASFWVLTSAYPGVPEVDLGDPGRLPRPRRPDDGLILGRFLALLGRPELEIENIRRTLALGGPRARLLGRLGSLELERGRLDAAERAFERLLALEPENVAALNELAFIAYREGRLERAQRLLERAVALRPEDRAMRENLERVRAARRRGTR